MAIEIYIFVLGAVLGAVIAFFALRRSPAQKNPAEKGPARNLTPFNEARDKKEEENKNKILSFAESKEEITNNDIEKLLNVSDSTAERYLHDLEKSGKLKQISDTGRGVYYVRV